MIKTNGLEKKKQLLVKIDDDFIGRDDDSIAIISSLSLGIFHV